MKPFVAVQTSTGDTYLIYANTAEDAYVVFGREILGMQGEIDTGNVDIDLYPVEPKLPHPHVQVLTP